MKHFKFFLSMFGVFISFGIEANIVLLDELLTKLVHVLPDTSFEAEMVKGLEGRSKRGRYLWEVKAEFILPDASKRDLFKSADWSKVVMGKDGPTTIFLTLLDKDYAQIFDLCMELKDSINLSQELYESKGLPDPLETLLNSKVYRSNIEKHWSKFVGFSKRLKEKKYTLPFDLKDVVTH